MWKNNSLGRYMQKTIEVLLSKAQKSQQKNDGSIEKCNTRNTKH